MNISQWKIGDRTFFPLEVDDGLLLINIPLQGDQQCQIAGKDVRYYQGQ